MKWYAHHKKQVLIDCVQGLDNPNLATPYPQSNRQCREYFADIDHVIYHFHENYYVSRPVELDGGDNAHPLYFLSSIHPCAETASKLLVNTNKNTNIRFCYHHWNIGNTD